MLPFQITQFSRYFSQDREIDDAATEQGAMVTVVTVSQADIIRAGLLLLLHSVQE